MESAVDNSKVTGRRVKTSIKRYRVGVDGSEEKFYMPIEATALMLYVDADSEPSLLFECDDGTLETCWYAYFTFLPDTKAKQTSEEMQAVLQKVHDKVIKRNESVKTFIACVGCFSEPICAIKPMGKCFYRTTTGENSS